MGWITGMLGAEGIRLAIEKVGFENLSGEAVRNALVTVKDLDTEGLTSAPLTLTEEEPVWGRFLQFTQIRQGKAVGLGSVEVPPLIAPLEE